MKKVFAVLFVFFLFVSHAFSVDEVDFTIKAFKVGFGDNSPQCKLTVTDALNYELDTHIHGTSIVLDPYVHRFLVSSSNNMVFADQVIFSYRVEGNARGKYNLTIALNAMGKESSDNTWTYIDTAYQIGNVTYVFTSGHDVSSSEDYYIADQKITNDQGSENQIRLGIDGDMNKTDGSFTVSWSVYGPRNDDVINDVWIARGSIALGLLSTSNDDFTASYEEAEPGTYTARCTITLSTE